jgi:hypothetical protein
VLAGFVGKPVHVIPDRYAGRLPVLRGRFSTPLAGFADSRLDFTAWQFAFGNEPLNLRRADGTCMAEQTRGSLAPG